MCRGITWSRRRSIALVAFCMLIAGSLYVYHAKNADLPTPPIFNSLIIYKISGLHDRFTQDELQHISHFTVQGEQCQSIFNNCKYRKGEPLWKGSYLGVGQLQDGRECRIALSFYGAFFKILGEPGYYRCEGSSDASLRLLIETVANAFAEDLRRKASGRSSSQISEEVIHP